MAFTYWRTVWGLMPSCAAISLSLAPRRSTSRVSRIRAVLRRSARQASDCWTVGELVIEPRRHRAQRAGRTLELSPREFQLLLELARETGAVVPKGVLSQRLDPLGEPMEFSAIEVHVSNLRRKIGAGLIHTVRGVGYMLAT